MKQRGSGGGQDQPAEKLEIFSWMFWDDGGMNDSNSRVCEATNLAHAASLFSGLLIMQDASRTFVRSTMTRLARYILTWNFVYSYTVWHISVCASSSRYIFIELSSTKPFASRWVISLYTVYYTPFCSDILYITYADEFLNFLSFLNVESGIHDLLDIIALWRLLIFSRENFMQIRLYRVCHYAIYIRVNIIRDEVWKSKCDKYI